MLRGLFCSKFADNVLMKNYKLIIQYDGTSYSGWQIQKNCETVQQKISDTLKLLLKEDINLLGSGRTDTGVHAFGQVANFRTEQDLNEYKFIYQVNSILPKDIAVLSMKEVDLNFHARFDAKRRSYLYLISRKKSPFISKYSYFSIQDFNILHLNELCLNLLGKKDFSSFCKNNADVENKICNIYFAHWKIVNGILLFNIQADRFLHSMVRTIIGTILNAGVNKYSVDYLNKVIEAKDRKAAAESVPAKGLFLYKVSYKL